MIYEFALSPEAFREAGNEFEEFDGISSLENFLFGNETDFGSLFLTADAAGGWLEQLRKQTEQLPVQSRHRAGKLLTRMSRIIRTTLLKLGADKAFPSFCGQEKTWVRIFSEHLTASVSHSGFIVSSELKSTVERAIQVSNLGSREWSNKQVPRTVHVQRSYAGQAPILKRVCDFAEHLYLIVPYLATEQATVKQLIDIAQVSHRQSGYPTTVTVITSSKKDSQENLSRYLKNAAADLRINAATFKVTGYSLPTVILNRRLLAELRPASTHTKRILWGMQMEHLWAGNRSEAHVEGNWWSVLPGKATTEIWRDVVEPALNEQAFFSNI